MDLMTDRHPTADELGRARRDAFHRLIDECKQRIRDAQAREATT